VYSSAGALPSGTAALWLDRLADLT
jgi:hypothetical protein